MNEVSDDFLLNMAEVSGALLGLFLVGAFFYVETGFRRLGPERGAFEGYFRASTVIVMVLFAIPLLLSMTLVVLDETWNAILFALLSVLLVAANVSTARQIKPVQATTGSNVLLINEVVGTLGVIAMVTLPWLLGGLDPSREDLTWSILISFATAFLSVFAVVISVFDISRSVSR